MPRSEKRSQTGDGAYGLLTPYLASAVNAMRGQSLARMSYQTRKLMRPQSKTARRRHCYGFTQRAWSFRAAAASDRFAWVGVLDHGCPGHQSFNVSSAALAALVPEPAVSRLPQPSRDVLDRGARARAGSLHRSARV